MKQGMKGTQLIFTLVVLVASSFLIGCSDTEFSQKPPSLVVQDVAASKVDILFVVDNSGSMYVEQVKMANAFPSLQQGMRLQGLDFRIAIITTDVVSANNPMKELGGLPAGALQNGEFIQFPDGKFFLDNQSANIQSQFKQTIQRKETLSCKDDIFIKAKCPSDDERGIYAANLALKKNKDGFFRPGSHIAFVFLTDEDERGNALNNPAHLPELQPVFGDYPESLIQTVMNDLGPSHTMSSHSVIVADQQCQSQQVYQLNNPYILARIGTFYRSLSDPTRLSRLNPSVNLNSYAPGKLLYGTVGSICATNYTNQLGSMLNVLVQDASKFVAKAELDCTPEEDTFKIESCPVGTRCTLSDDNKSVVFQPALSPNQSARVSYLCYK